MATTLSLPIVRQTGFKVGATDVRFGILVPSGASSMPDWSGQPQMPRLEGAGIIVDQILLSSGPSQITYRLWLESAEDAQDLDGLVTQTGTLTLVHGMHARAVPNASQVFIHNRVYDRITSVTLRLIANRVVFTPSGTVELDATFQVG